MKYTQGIFVDGTYFDIPIVSLQRTADFLDKDSTGRTEDGDMYRELIGVYYNYTLMVGTVNDTGNYRRFYDKMTEPTEFHDFILPDSEGKYEFRGYVNSVSDEMSKIYANKTEFKGFTCKMTAKEPARRP